MLSAFAFDTIQNLMEKELRRFPSAALVTPEGDLLTLAYQSLADIGTLPVAALTCHQYFQLKLGDVVIINDPYSGGSLLSSINLVAGVCFDRAEIGATADALICARIPFKPRIAIAGSVEAEGVRIPPTPLVSKVQLNREMINMISAHPLAPAQFEAGLLRALDSLKEALDSLARLRVVTGVQLNKKMIKEWLNLANDRFQDQLGELAVGEARAEVQLTPKSRISLKVEIKDHRVGFNFTGSTAPDRYALSDAATLGACVGALIAALNTEVPINGGVLRTVDVVAPLGSVVHSRYPAPVFLGFTDGTSIVANLVLKLLGQIDRKLQMAQSGLSQCAFEIDFGKGKYFVDDLEPGAAASRERRGSDGLDIWRRSHLQRSVETIERMYPLKVRSTALRSQSGGSGQLSGGDGVTKVYEVLQTSRLRWNISRGPLKPEGAGGGKSAIGPEILVQRVGGEREELGEQGELELAPGDQLIVHSAGGGGYGEVSTNQAT